MQPFSLATIRSSPEYQKYHIDEFWGFCASYIHSRRHDFLLFVASFSRDRFVPCVKCYNFQTRPRPYTRVWRILRILFSEFCWPVRPVITPSYGGKIIGTIYWENLIVIPGKQQGPETRVNSRNCRKFYSPPSAHSKEREVLTLPSPHHDLQVRSRCSSSENRTAADSA